MQFFRQFFNRNLYDLYRDIRFRFTHQFRFNADLKAGTNITIYNTISTDFMLPLCYGQTQKVPDTFNYSPLIKLELPIFFLHEFFKVYAFYTKMFTNIWNFSCVFFINLFSNNERIFKFSFCNYEWIGDWSST